MTRALVRRSLAAATLLPALAAGNARAQSCCSPATTPSAAIEHPAPPRGELAVGLYAEHYAVSGGKRGRRSFAYPGDRRSNAQSVTLGAHYGVTNRLSTAILVPWNRRERSDRSTTGERLSRSQAGLGDAALLGYARLLPEASRREWTVGAGVKLATGRSRAQDRSGELPQELQPGSGANDVLLASTFGQGFGRFTAGAGLTWRRTGTLTKIDALPGDREIRRQYRFGNELLYGMSVAWSPDARWGFELGVRGRHAEPDQATALTPDTSAAGVETLPSTGGERLFLAPVVRLAFLETRATVSLGALIPVHEDLRGSQLAARTGIRLSVEGHP